MEFTSAAQAFLDILPREHREPQPEPAGIDPAPDFIDLPRRGCWKTACWECGAISAAACRNKADCVQL
jgi:hypothetical protein